VIKRADSALLRTIYADQSGQALPGYSRKARHNLVADYSVEQSVVVIDTHTDLE